RRMIQPEAFHQMVSSGPVTMTVKHGTGDAATQHSRKRFLVGFCLPVSDNLVALREAANVQPFFVCRATTKTGEVWRVGFLDAFHSKVQCPTSNVQSPTSEPKLSPRSFVTVRRQTLDVGRWTLDRFP